MHIVLAHQKNWPQHWVDQADPSYIAELLTFMAANSDHEMIEADRDPKQRESRMKHRRLKRKLQLVKRAHGVPHGDS